MINNTFILPGDSVLISDIGPQPDNRSDPGSTLVCVTSNINTACCRQKDNNGVTNATAGSVGEWLNPNGIPVSRPRGHVVDLERIGFTHHVRLARVVPGSTPPLLGVYTCQVPELSTGILINATIKIQYYRKYCSKNIIVNF